eukprot:TRINITY_DN15288_c0_g2_i1.p1 TRINITY_DN15288_c0_g2~~TRINITY_DN15288_c0_g2_i1.p1  ORF type:complete len:520 (+),score=59.63 TRINITY_DN15288_c0_g2_i1:40-1599(+)
MALQGLLAYTEVAKCGGGGMTCEELLYQLEGIQALTPHCRLPELLYLLVEAEAMLAAFLIFASQSVPLHLFFGIRYTETLSSLVEHNILPMLEVPEKDRVLPIRSRQLNVSATRLQQLALGINPASCFRQSSHWSIASKILRKGVARLRQLISIMHEARQEPIYASRALAKNEIALCALQFFKPSQLSVWPTEWYWYKPFGNQEHFWLTLNRDPSLVRQAWQEFERSVQKLSKEEAMVVDWFPTGGTLLAFLRYGELLGTLAHGKIDIVDRDVGIIVVLATSEWYRFVSALTALLTSLGWAGCRLKRDFTDSNFTRRETESMACVRFFVDAQRVISTIVLDITPMVPVFKVQGSPGMVCNAELEDRSVCKMPGDSQLLDLVSHVVCDNSGCRAEGISIPSRLWQDRGHCSAYGQPTSCPLHALEHLAYFLGADITSYALPDFACQAECCGKRPDNYETRRLFCEGLNVWDVALLRQRRLWLKSRGFLTTNLTTVDNWKHCIRMQIPKGCSRLPAYPMIT